MAYLPTISGSWWGLLVIFCFVEMVFFLFHSPQYLLSNVGKDEDARELSGKYRSSALSIAGLVFAGITFVLANENDLPNVEPALKVLYVSVGLLIFAFLIEGLTRHRYVWLLYQEITLEYGVIGLLLGLWLLSKAVAPSSANVSFGILVIGVVLKVREVVGEIQAYSGLGEESRRQFWLELINSCRARITNSH
jgi:hypothetical protein